MLVVALPWNRRELEYLEDESDLFDLYMENSTQQFYLVIQENKITWIGQGTVPGKFSYQIMSRTFTMNGNREKAKCQGNVGFLGNYSSIEDAVHKLFPSKGYCVTNMHFTEYIGQKLRGHSNHYNVIEPILCLMGKNPNDRLEHFFEVLGWGNRKVFHCSGMFEHNMRLFIDNEEIPNLESWFASFCNIALR